MGISACIHDALKFYVVSSTALNFMRNVIVSPSYRAGVMRSIETIFFFEINFSCCMS